MSLATNIVLSKPTVVNILATFRCNLKCRHCDIPLHSDPSKELSSEQWEKVLRQLRKWLGTAVMVWAGGEPFMRKDILRLIKYGAQLGMLNNVVSNGQLIDKALAQRIVNAGTFGVIVSLDGMEKGHDFVRGERTFAKATAATHFLNEARRDRKNRMRIMVNVTIMETNLDEIIHLVNWAEAEGLDGVSISPLAKTGGSYDPNPEWFESSRLWPRSLDKLDRLIDELIERSGRKSVVKNPASHLRALKEYYHDPTHLKPADFNCRVGHDDFWIDPCGFVFLCPYVRPLILGNVVESTPEQIWKSAEASVNRKAIAACRKNCLLPCLYKRSLRDNFGVFLKLFK
ncbi:MAG: radical SAM protein [Planctomycetota bacterium]